MNPNQLSEKMDEISVLLHHIFLSLTFQKNYIAVAEMEHYSQKNEISNNRNNAGYILSRPENYVA